MRNIALFLSYDGSAYHGWQSQSNAESIQSTINRAVSSLFNEDLKVVGCGRTDSGVHAKKYVSSVRTNSQIPCERIAYALNSMLPSDIAIKTAIDVADDFHPVHSCIEKEYTYYIYTDKLRNPFYEKRALHYRYSFDIDSVRLAASHFVGTHDFASMQSVGTPVKSTVRTVYKCDVTQNADMVSVCISANGFLYNMARTMVGTLLEVASGKFTPDAISEILGSCDRSRAGATVAPYGLYMTNVIYPDRFGLTKL